MSFFNQKDNYSALHRARTYYSWPHQSLSSRYKVFLEYHPWTVDNPCNCIISYLLLNHPFRTRDSSLWPIPNNCILCSFSSNHGIAWIILLWKVSLRCFTFILLPVLLSRNHSFALHLFHPFMKVFQTFMS